MEPERISDRLGELAEYVEAKWFALVEDCLDQVKDSGLPREHRDDAVTSLLMFVAADALAISLSLAGKDKMLTVMWGVLKSAEVRMGIKKKPPETGIHVPGGKEAQTEKA